MTKSNINLNNCRSAYTTPDLKIFSVGTEKGFAASPGEDWSDGTIDDNYWNPVI